MESTLESLGQCAGVLDKAMSALNKGAAAHEFERVKAALDTFDVIGYAHAIAVFSYAVFKNAPSLDDGQREGMFARFDAAHSQLKNVLALVEICEGAITEPDLPNEEAKRRYMFYLERALAAVFDEERVYYVKKAEEYRQKVGRSPPYASYWFPAPDCRFRGGLDASVAKSLVRRRLPPGLGTRSGPDVGSSRGRKRSLSLNSPDSPSKRQNRGLYRGGPGYEILWDLTPDEREILKRASGGLGQQDRPRENSQPEDGEPTNPGLPEHPEWMPSLDDNGRGWQATYDAFLEICAANPDPVADWEVSKTLTQIMDTLLGDGGSLRKAKELRKQDQKRSDEQVVEEIEKMRVEMTSDIVHQAHRWDHADEAFANAQNHVLEGGPDESHWRGEMTKWLKQKNDGQTALRLLLRAGEAVERKVRYLKKNPSHLRLDFVARRDTLGFDTLEEGEKAVQTVSRTRDLLESSRMFTPFSKLGGKRGEKVVVDKDRVLGVGVV